MKHSPLLLSYGASLVQPNFSAFWDSKNYGAELADALATPQNLTILDQGVAVGEKMHILAQYHP